MSGAKQKKPNLKVIADADTVARECLSVFVAAAEHAVKAKNVFHLAISGGHTPIKFFELLGSNPDAKNLPWDKINLFWVDERYVPHDSPHSNYKLAADTFLTKIPIPKQNVHPIPTDDVDSGSAAKKYETTIRSALKIKSGQLPEFDLIILGMGADGHTGSLFPNSNAAFDSTDLACVVYLLDQKLSDQPITRITLTHPVLCAASQIVILVTGREKAQILKEVLTCEPDEVHYPVHWLWPALDKITWLVDSPAAKLL
jgi:6-phosphogluconolactonase